MKKVKAWSLYNLKLQSCVDKTHYREYMEDFSFVNKIVLPKIKSPHNRLLIIGICDGHGGHEVAQFISHNIKDIISEGLSDLTDFRQLCNKTLISKILTNCFAILETYLEKQLPDTHAGSTCAMVLYLPSLNIWYGINCGDSSVYGIQYNPQQDALKISRMTTLHKPDLQSEENRIKTAGGFITNMGVSRLCGILAVSRSFGDYEYRNYGMTQIPEIVGPFTLKGPNTITTDNNFIGFLVMSDGITDFISDNNIQLLLSKNWDRRYSFADILAKNTKSQDNVSIISAFI